MGSSKDVFLPVCPRSAHVTALVRCESKVDVGMGPRLRQRAQRYEVQPIGTDLASSGQSSATIAHTRSLDTATHLGRAHRGHWQYNADGHQHGWSNLGSCLGRCRIAFISRSSAMSSLTFRSAYPLGVWDMRRLWRTKTASTLSPYLTQHMWWLLVRSRI